MKETINAICNHWSVKILFLAAVAVVIGGIASGWFGKLKSTSEPVPVEEIAIDDVSKLPAREQAIVIEIGKKMQARLDKALVMERQGVPFKPIMSLQPYQNKLCLAVALFTETEGEIYSAKEINAWAIVNRAIDTRRDDIYKSNVCAAVNATSQYSGMGPYKNVIEDIVWGNTTKYTPPGVTKDEKRSAAWKDCVEIATNLIDGKLSRKTLATHFLSPRGMNGRPWPSWPSYLKPALVKGDQGLHIYFRDYGWDRKTGEIVYFNKNNPYDSQLHR